MPTAAIASTWRAIRIASEGGTAKCSSIVSANCMIGPMTSGPTTLPGPGRRPRAHDTRSIAPIVTQIESVSGRPVCERIAPMNTSSGPGPSWFQSITATELAMSRAPTANKATWLVRANTRRGPPAPRT